MRRITSLGKPPYVLENARYLRQDSSMTRKEDIEAAEKEIDSAFASSPLVRLNYTQAMWTLLAVNEDAYFKAIHTLQHEDYLRTFADARMNALTYPLRVCFASCNVGTARFRREYVSSDYEHAWKWLEAAEDYCQFCTIFPLWHRAKLDITISGATLLIDNGLNPNKDYEAYNRLVHKEGRGEAPVALPNSALVELILSHSTIRQDSFLLNFNPSLVAKLVAFLTPHMINRRTLPNDWHFDSFSLEQYRKVLLTLQAMMFAWHTVRAAVANNGMPGLGYPSSVWVVPKDELLARLIRYTGGDRGSVSRIIDLITFGSNQVRSPDISVQPLIDLKERSYAVAPFVLLNTDVERNLCVLLNQIPSEKATYSRLSNEKEKATKAEIKQFLAGCGFDFRSGQVEGTNLDLAIIDHRNKVCLCLELKWFIEPAEIREIEQRTEELAQGISQAKKIKALFECGNSHLIHDVLRVSMDYNFLCAVGSVNWIGYSDVQDLDVPIIKVWHLLHWLKENGSLLNAITWLRRREYLPVHGRDYSIEPWQLSCGKWAATWYGIKPLEESEQETGRRLGRA